MTSLRENREGCGRGSEVDWRLLASTAVAPVGVARCSALHVAPTRRGLVAFLDTATHSGLACGRGAPSSANPSISTFYERAARRATADSPHGPTVSGERSRACKLTNDPCSIRTDTDPACLDETRSVDQADRSRWNGIHLDDVRR